MTADEIANGEHLVLNAFNLVTSMMGGNIRVVFYIATAMALTSVLSAIIVGLYYAVGIRDPYRRQ